ncbi:hypothetical protein WA538_004252 [Blastocystis sp. DL]
MTVVSVTSDKKYAKLYEDIVFTITYDTELTAREKEAEWSVYYTPDIIFRENRRKCNVVRKCESNRVILEVIGFKETLNGLTTIELRNVGCFTLSSVLDGVTDDIILVVQTYSEDEINVVLERAVEQVM